MSIVVYIISLGLGFIFVNFFLMPNLILPFVYGIPKSLFYYFKGVLLSGAVIRYFLTIGLWALGGVGFIFFLSLLPPAFINWKVFEVGAVLFFIMSVLFSVTKRGRATLNHDFWDASTPYAHDHERFASFAEEALLEYLNCFPEEASKEIS